MSYFSSRDSSRGPFSCTDERVFTRFALIAGNWYFDICLVLRVTYSPLRTRRYSVTIRIIVDTWIHTGSQF